MLLFCSLGLRRPRIHYLMHLSCLRIDKVMSTVASLETDELFACVIDTKQGEGST